MPTLELAFVDLDEVQLFGAHTLDPIDNGTIESIGLWQCCGLGSNMISGDRVRRRGPLVMTDHGAFALVARQAKKVDRVLGREVLLNHAALRTALKPAKDRCRLLLAPSTITSCPDALRRAVRTWDVRKGGATARR